MMLANILDPPLFITYLSYWSGSVFHSGIRQGALPPGEHFGPPENTDVKMLDPILGRGLSALPRPHPAPHGGECLNETLVWIERSPSDNRSKH
jgi:hypothetical protein